MDITTIKYPSHNDLVQWYYQLAQNIAEAAGVTPEDVNALIDAYIKEHPYPVVPADIITASNAAQNVVTSVNGEKGDVTVSGGGGVPENVVTTDNIAQNAVTSFNGAKGEVTGVVTVNGKSGKVTVSESPANVITGDNIATNAVTSFNGAKGDVTGVTSVNGISAQNVVIGAVDSTVNSAYVVKVSNDAAIIIANITTQCVNQTPPRYAGVCPKCGYTYVVHIMSAEMSGDTTPFVKNGVSIETNEGVWTLIFSGIASGQQVMIGDKKTAWVTLLASGVNYALQGSHV